MVVKEMLVVPLVASLILGIAFELIQTAESMSEKVILYTQEMENALDCAFVGVPIEKCSPMLSNTEFKSDLDDYRSQLQQINETLDETTKKYISEKSNIPKKD